MVSLRESASNQLRLAQQVCGGGGIRALFATSDLEQKRPIWANIQENDHIRKQRLDLGLKQHEVSRIIGVTRAMISAWEMNPVEPAVKYIPKIIEFLGYVPFERGETLGQRISIYRKTLGLSHYQFAKELGMAVYDHELGARSGKARGEEDQTVHGWVDRI